MAKNIIFKSLRQIEWVIVNHPLFTFFVFEFLLHHWLWSLLQSPISPQSDRDVLGKSFKEIQQFIQDNANKSLREVEQIKKSTNQVTVY